jgi:hypothetical protein
MIHGIYMRMMSAIVRVWGQYNAVISSSWIERVGRGLFDYQHKKGI